MNAMIPDDVVAADLRDGEKAYPIYRIEVRWSEAYPPGRRSVLLALGLPPLPAGRFWNATGWDAMLLEERSAEGPADRDTCSSGGPPTSRPRSCLSQAI